jgi:hypothetical protein
VGSTVSKTPQGDGANSSRSRLSCFLSFASTSNIVFVAPTPADCKERERQRSRDCKEGETRREFIQSEIEREEDDEEELKRSNPSWPEKLVSAIMDPFQ